LEEDSCAKRLVQDQLRSLYCQKVGGHIGYSRYEWKKYENGHICKLSGPLSADHGGEALANLVGYYVAVGSAEASLRVPSEAVEFVEGPFTGYLKGCVSGD
jgi:hypothetical protein